MSNLKHEYPIVFYDGDCGFCSKTVQFVLNNRKNNLYFMALQNEKARNILSKNNIKIDYSTFYFYEKESIFQKSTAALKLSKHLKNPYYILGFILHIIPKRISDYFYDTIAKRRHKIINPHCLLPKEEEKKLFL